MQDNNQTVSKDVKKSKSAFENIPRIGVYICHCGTNIAGVINVEELRQYVEKLPNIVVAKRYDYFCSVPGQGRIREDIQKLNLNRVIVAACSPRMHEPTFRKVSEEGGINPYLFEMVNIREQNTWVHMKEPGEALRKAKDLIRMAVARAARLEELTPKVVPVQKKVLIIGAGIAGISAALDLADSNYEVYLVERTPTIGGKMAQLDKTFPTMDCSACILTPKMVEITRRPNIKLLTYSEVKSVDGYVGDFKVTVVKKPRYVIEDRCNGCGKCPDVCPIEVPSEFDEGLSPRKAIYVPFPQAVPQRYTIDRDYCIECFKCVDACGALRAINFDQKPEEVVLNVGTIIVATGYDIYDARDIEEYGYGRYSNVITALEMERILSASGPTLGEIKKPSDHQKPKRIAYIQCVGSRDDRRNPYCSRVCCMYAIKQARQIKEKSPKTEVYICYTDIRSFGKGYEEFYEIAAKEYGVQFIRGRLAEVREDPKTQNLTLRVEETLIGEPVELEADMMVLSVGLVPGAGAGELQKILKIPTSQDNFFAEAHPKLRPVDTVVDGVFICGAAQGPKDIPDVVAQAKAAASSASVLMSQGFFTLEPYFAIVNEDLCTGCGKCVNVCPYTAIKLNEARGKVEVTDVNCKGCGSCAATCPVGAMQLRHFKDDQIYALVENLIPS